MELTATIPLSKIQRIELYQNLSRLPMATIKARTGADYIINGGIYSFHTFKPFGNVKIDGKIIYSPGYGEYGFTWDEGPDISYERLPSNKRSYLGCVGMVLGGVKQVLHYNADMGGKRQRSAIGLKDGNLVLYACNGVHSKTPEALQTYAMKHGWNYGMMLDGGGSSQMVRSNLLRTTGKAASYKITFWYTSKRKQPVILALLQQLHAHIVSLRLLLRTERVVSLQNGYSGICRKLDTILEKSTASLVQNP